MLKFTNLAIRRGPRQLFHGVNFTIHQGNKVGLTGANGCGKSSLFALLLGELHSDEGEVDVPADITTYDRNLLGGSSTGDRFFGLMDELKIYNRALSHAKITGCYMCRD